MRVLALARFRLRAAVSGRVLLAPLVAFVLVQVVGLVGNGGQAAVQLSTAVAFSLPVLAWAARQVLDAEPDEQVRLSRLAVGGEVRQRLAGLLAAAVLVLPAALLSALAALAQVDGCGRPAGTVLAGAGLALTTGLAAVAVGALASRAMVGAEGGGVLVLVGAPVLVAVLSTVDHPVVTSLVPRVGQAVRAAFDTPGCSSSPFAAEAASASVQVLLWSLVVLGLRLAWGSGLRRAGRSAG